MFDFRILRCTKPKAVTAAILVTMLLLTLALAQPITLACEETQPQSEIPTPEPGSYANITAQQANYMITGSLYKPSVILDVRYQCE